MIKIVAIDVQSVSASLSASASYASIGTFTVPAGENRSLIAVIAKGNAGDPFRLEFNAGNNKNYQFEALFDDDPSVAGKNQMIPIPIAVSVPANSVITVSGSNSSGSAVTSTVWLIFKVG